MSRMDPLTVTLDTNAFNARKLACVKAAAGALPVDLVRVTVTDRELETALYTKPSEGVVPETAVWGEAQWGSAIWADETATNLLESILYAMSGDTFPAPGKRENLTKGYRTMLRDALILETHAREGRDILVSENTKQYGKAGSPLRHQLENLCSTRIMTVDEFCSECDRLRTST